MLETVTVDDRVNQNHTMGPLVECLGDVSKSLLPCCVPYVKTNLMGISLNLLDLEIYSNCAQEVSMEFVLSIAHKKAGLADTAVAHNEKL